MHIMQRSLILLVIAALSSTVHFVRPAATATATAAETTTTTTRDSTTLSSSIYKTTYIERKFLPTTNDWVGPLPETSSQDWQGITASSDGQNVAAGINGQGIWYSHNYGNTWHQSNAPAAGFLWYSIDSSSSGQIVVAGASVQPAQIYVSVDYAQTFTLRKTFDSTNYFGHGGVAISSDGSKMIATVR